MKALSKDPAERFQTADALGRELQNIRKGLHPSASKAQMDETRFASTQVMKRAARGLEEGARDRRPNRRRNAGRSDAGRHTGTACASAAGAQLADSGDRRGSRRPRRGGISDVLVPRQRRSAGDRQRSSGCSNARRRASGGRCERDAAGRRSNDRRGPRATGRRTRRTAAVAGHSDSFAGATAESRREASGSTRATTAAGGRHGQRDAEWQLSVRGTGRRPVDLRRGHVPPTQAAGRKGAADPRGAISPEPDGAGRGIGQPAVRVHRPGARQARYPEPAGNVRHRDRRDESWETRRSCRKSRRARTKSIWCAEPRPSRPSTRRSAPDRRRWCHCDEQAVTPLPRRDRLPRPGAHAARRSRRTTKSSRAASTRAA